MLDAHAIDVITDGFQRPPVELLALWVGVACLVQRHHTCRTDTALLAVGRSECVND
jgi:hypothetical protein